MLKVYYRHTIQTPYWEAEWAWARECFFNHLTPRKAEVVAIKEELYRWAKGPGVGPSGLVLG